MNVYYTASLCASFILASCAKKLCYSYASNARGYEAVGGEALVFPFVVIVSWFVFKIIGCFVESGIRKIMEILHNGKVR